MKEVLCAPRVARCRRRLADRPIALPEICIHAAHLRYSARVVLCQSACKFDPSGVNIADRMTPFSAL
jgi:hypothetical protein